MGSPEETSQNLDELFSDVETPENVEILPAFHNPLTPKYDVKSEKEWHRMAAYMLSRGHTIREVAEYVAKTPEHVAQIRRQPWFQQLLAQICDLNRDESALNLLKGAAIESIEVLVDLSHNADKDSVRQAAANNLLDKYLKMNPEEKEPAPEDPEAEARMLEKQIETLRKQEEQEAAKR